MDADDKPALDISLTPVDASSNIAAIGYHAPTQRMAVQFKNGGTYVYADVPPEAHAAFAAADSPGKHFHANIRHAYQSTKHE